MTTTIPAFRGDLAFCSNFWFCDIVIDGNRYGSSEHAYQALKMKEPRHELLVRIATTPALAKRLARKYPMKDNWEQIKLAEMERILRVKFQIPELKQKLLDTGDLILEETNTWKDTYWGIYNGRGTNYLGKILMKIRTELKVQI